MDELLIPIYEGQLHTINAEIDCLETKKNTHEDEMTADDWRHLSNLYLNKTKILVNLISVKCKIYRHEVERFISIIKGGNNVESNGKE